jgi:hypothetical protein
MPIMSVKTTRNGRPVMGYRYGTRGKIYTGPGARAKALLQAQAMRAAGYQG